MGFGVVVDCEVQFGLHQQDCRQALHAENVTGYPWNRMKHMSTYYEPAVYLVTVSYSGSGSRIDASAPQLELKSCARLLHRCAVEVCTLKCVRNSQTDRSKSLSVR